MKKNKIKMIIGFGATTSLVAVGSVILSCGNSNSNLGPNQSKINAVTATMVANYVKAQINFIPSATADAPKTAPRPTLTKVTLNGLDGLAIAISNWTANVALGSVIFDVSIFGEGFTTKVIAGVTYDGWKTDENRLNVVTAEMVSIYVKGQAGFTPSPTTNVPTIAPSKTLTNATLNGASNLTITILNWVSDATHGSVTFDVSISKPSFTTKNIIGVTYDGWPTDPDQQKLNLVTKQDVADYVKTQIGFIPSVTEDAPVIASKSVFDNVALNGVDGLTIIISNWVQNLSLGSVTFDVSISKYGLATRDITGVTYDGWKTDQNRLNLVIAPMVANYVKTQTGFIPDLNKDVPAATPSTTLNDVTINGLKGLTITISNWTPDYTVGSVKFDASISRPDLIAKIFSKVTYDGYKAYDTKIDDTNVAATENKLWTFNDSTRTLEIVSGVTIITSNNHLALKWGNHNINIVANIIFPNTLTNIGNLAFLDTLSTNLNSLTFPASLEVVGTTAFGNLSTTSLQFLGAIPKDAPARTLILAPEAFKNTQITYIIAGDSGTTQGEWQDWARAYCWEAFKS